MKVLIAGDEALDKVVCALIKRLLWQILWRKSYKEQLQLIHEDHPQGPVSTV